MSPPVVDPSTIELGQSLPPHGPHTITFNLPGFEIAKRFRNHDMTVFAVLKSIYPRFCPFGLAAALCGGIAQKLSVPEGNGCAVFLSAEALRTNQAYAVSKFREEARLEPSDFKYHVVEINGVRLYVVVFPMAKAPGALFQWSNGGLGVSTRTAESLLPHLDSLVNLGEFPDCVGAPEATYLPETDSHSMIRERIASLLMRACATEHKKPVRADDVFLYQTGMAAICRMHEAVLPMGSGPTVVFGAVFHSSYHIFEEGDGGFKHYGHATDADVDDFEKYLEGGGKCRYVFTEFPSNPVLGCIDLMRLRKLADKYNFIIVVDDTVGSFANIDVLAAADAVITSLTKSFSGYADVMGGSIALNPNSPAYSALKQAVSSRFHNELFAGDAAQLLSNNKDYFARSAILNRNAKALAAYFQSLTQDPACPIKRVYYPPHSQGSQYLKEFMRKPTAEFPEPGYGCLLSIEFENLEQTAMFMDNANFFQGPHLGAHLTLAMPFNYIVYREHPEVHAKYGLVENQVRFSVGLEPEEVILERCKVAMSKVTA